MSISKFIFGENIPLLQVGNFSQSYVLIVENTFVMGKDNTPISLSTVSQITIEQEWQDDLIYNNILVENLEGYTENEVMKSFLEQTLALSGISPKIRVKRNLDGKILSVEDQHLLKNDWNSWKANKLEMVFTEQKEQQKFIRNYENGMVNFEQNFKKNLQYLLLLPEIYSIIFPPNQHFTFLCSQSELNSRLVEGMEYQYQLKLVKLDEDATTVSLELHAVLNNKDEITKKFLNKVYLSTQEFSLTDFDFKIEIKYVFEKLNSKIISGELKFIEKLHDHLSYSITMNLKESIESVM
ncbi:hypothetical protein [Chryseobacterium caseinilyticum]|uniref:DUF3822 family protein n=1 Tax=Chryseobacterium caseinilyticum TaxID=2771428 RepID=A0ABR8ZB17_9FLAO|nr:hypothetical protein [Chryseobacterium caseinilyticum]MBD8082524.1 hypothetical protein [Chryseobacterium caseinilyticum]